MNQNKMHLTLVVDKSGSMDSIREAAENGVNALLENRKSQSLETSLSLYEFSNTTRKLFDGNAKDCPSYRLRPMGSTAYLDAIGQAINETGAKLSSLSENERPGLVVVTIVTDGEENSSKEFTFDKIKEMIDHQKSKYSWQFDFLCCDGFTQKKALELGCASLVYSNTASGSAALYQNLSNSYTRRHTSVSKGVSASQIVNFSDEEMNAIT